MKFIYIVQGEGRGHMTQALAMQQILASAGHEVVAVFVGKNKKREIPAYFTEKFTCPVETFQSPYFATDEANKSIKIGKTLWQNIFKIKIYLKGLKQIHLATNKYQPDLIINFYDILGGMYNFVYRPKVKMVALAHQYLAAHPSFPFAPARALDKPAYFLLNYLTSYGVKARLCLSFRQYPPHAGLTIVPPLLREEIISMQPTQGDYIHGYILNAGYSQEIMHWNEKHPLTKLYFFWDKKEATKETVVTPTLTFHTLDDREFLRKMAGAKAYVSTAGFESICEAMYLAKPILMVPVAGHYEQACNALDAVAAGAGITANSFDLSPLIDYLPEHVDKSEEFRAWANSAKKVYLQALEKVVREG